MSKKESRRKRHLKNIEERKVARAPRTVSPAHPEPFWVRYSVEMTMVFLLAVALCVGMILIKKAAQPAEEIQQIFSSVLDIKKEELAAKYPDGYQIVAIFFGQGIPLNANAFFKGLKVDWKRATLLKGKQGEFKINLPYIYYESQHLVRDLVFDIPKVPGASSSLQIVGNIYLDMELLSIDENKVLCAFGLRAQ